MRYLVLFVAFVFAGCATIITGTTTDVAVNSDPAEAQIEINGQSYGQTPTTLTLDSDHNHTMTLSLEGYEEKTIRLRKSTSGWVAGNLILGGIPGFIIDAATGGMYVLSPKQVNATIIESASAENTIYIKVAMNVDRELRKIGELHPVR